jgi:BirA family biotin operon repressor/biotin-[acetyl-CoA-carboxylase] ligase
VSDLAPEVLEPLLRGRFGRPYRFVESCPSTQRLFAEDVPEGALVATDFQSAGRGRLGRGWVAPPGKAILCSVVLRPAAPTVLWPELSVIAGDAVAAAIRAETGLAAMLGYPNDVLVEGRKVVGVLPEASSGRVVLGIGVNVNQGQHELPGDTPKPPTSLRLELGEERPRGPLLAAILLELERAYDTWTAPHRRYD